jgi:ATP-binding cassette subfamily B multidrug efflux pump
MFRWFENRLHPTAEAQHAPPPGHEDSLGGDRRGLLRFYWHFARQARGLLAGLFAAGFVLALADAAIPVFIGRLVSLATSLGPDRLLEEAWPFLASMAVAVLIIRPLAVATWSMIANQALAPGLSNLIRWQSHWHVVRQSWSFFQNDFAGRVANRVMQTGPGLRESIVASIDAVWYIIIYGTTAMILLAGIDWRLAVPIALWFAVYALLLRRFVPRLKELSRRMSEVRSALTGRIVDSYTNILTVKLFARARDEDDFVRAAVDDHTEAFKAQLRTISKMVLSLAVMNACLLAGIAAVSIWLWKAGTISIGNVATALPLAWQLTNMSGWVARMVTSIFENVGLVQDGMRTIAVPRQMADAPEAGELRVGRGAIAFEGVTFGYGTQRGVLHDLNLAIAAGERVGLVGHSGAGKSTLVNLLLRFHAPEQGRITVDEQDIAGVTAESLRAQVAVVTQDTSLLHRSIRENIRYGRPSASEMEVRAAAAQAEASEFIENLEDWAGRRGFDAHVGERGVKLSGGQRQRVAIARVILKNAPILVLDEATSALDSEVEAAIQGQLEQLMEGRTVIAIAHRLSTIARMDRLVVLDAGRIVEHGSHAELLAKGGAYARMWNRQSGGFIAA